MMRTIRKEHGNGGKQTYELIDGLFKPIFGSEILKSAVDSTIFSLNDMKVGISTDSFVVKPYFFKGGDIGKLAVCGTVNDLAVAGLEPKYITVSFIIEEGFSLQMLEEIVKSMGEVCLEVGVKIVTGDTKVVEKGSVDGIFINTSGIGYVKKGYEIKPIEAGDRIIVSGCIGEHGTTIALKRYDIKVKGNFKSDCAPLNPFMELIKEYFTSIKIMRDPTRGGLATVLHEFSELCGLGIHLIEEQIPINEGVKVVNQLLGLDPLYMACEGRMVMVVKESEAQEILDIIQSMNQGKEAKIIGKFIEGPRESIFIENCFGGKRILTALEGNMLPRIC